MTLPLWFSNLLFWSAQVALLVVVAGFLPRLFQIRQPHVLLAYWRALLLITLLLPSVQSWHRLPSVAPVAVSTGAFTSSFPAPPAPAPTHWQFPDIQVVSKGIGIAILGGILLRFAVLALGLLKLRRFREASVPVTDAAEFAAILNQMHATVGATADFRVSGDVDSPVTFGLARPVILLPERFLETDARFQSAIACHELLHVRRRDWTHHLAEEIVRAVFWFHPAFAWLISRVRLAREQVVDLEVINLTNARKPYLEALLEFTAGRARIASIPAPPFLAECQLVERVSLMLKEVRMSQRRLILSLGVISCCLLVVVALSARSFPLKRAPLQSAPQTGVTGGVAGGVSGGISGEVNGGVSGGVAGGVNRGVSGENARTQGGGEPNVAYNSIWTDTVKRGPMVRQVRGLGKLVSAEDSTLVAKITIPVFLSVDVRPNQSAAVDTHMGVVKGHVVSINPSGDTCSIDIALDSALPERATAGLSIDGTIDIEKLENVLYVGRPVHGEANTAIGLFKISKDGLEAQRVSVKLGRSSVNTIEILQGLQPGDKIILSDMSDYDNVERIRLTDDQHVRKQ